MASVLLCSADIPMEISYTGYVTASGTASSYTASAYSAQTAMDYVNSGSASASASVSIRQIYFENSSGILYSGDHAWTVTPLRISSKVISGSKSELSSKRLKIHLSASSHITTAGNISVPTALPQFRIMFGTINSAKSMSDTLMLIDSSTAIWNSATETGSIPYSYSQKWLTISSNNSAKLLNLSESAKQVWELTYGPVASGGRYLAGYQEKEPLNYYLYSNGSVGGSPLSALGIRKFDMPSGCGLVNYGEDTGWQISTAGHYSGGFMSASARYSGVYDWINLSSLLTSTDIDDTATGTIYLVSEATVSSFNDTGISNVPEKVLGIDPVSYVFSLRSGSSTLIWSNGTIRSNYNIGVQSAINVPVPIDITGTLSSTASESSTSTTLLTSWYYSPVYSSTATTGQVLEQVFTQEPDPLPNTPDWMHTVTAVDMSEWDEFAMSAYYTSIVCEEPASYFPYDNILYRAITSATPLSAEMPLDGVVSSLHYLPGSAWWSAKETADVFWSASARLLYTSTQYPQPLPNNAGDSNAWQTLATSIVDEGSGVSSVVYTSNRRMRYVDRPDLDNPSGSQGIGPYGWQIPTSYGRPGWYTASRFGTGWIPSTHYYTIGGFSSDWQPVSAIAGTGTTTASAAFGFWGMQGMMMNPSGLSTYNSSDYVNVYNQGMLSSMASGCGMSGIVQFRKRVGPGVSTSKTTAIFPIETSQETTATAEYRAFVSSATP